MYIIPNTSCKGVTNGKRSALIYYIIPQKYIVYFSQLMFTYPIQFRQRIPWSWQNHSQQLKITNILKRSGTAYFKSVTRKPAFIHTIDNAINCNGSFGNICRHDNLYETKDSYKLFNQLNTAKFIYIYPSELVETNKSRNEKLG